MMKAKQIKGARGREHVGRQHFNGGCCQRERRENAEID